VSTHAIESPAIPVLAGALPPPGRRTFAQRRRDRRESLFPGATAKMFDEPIVISRSLLGRVAFVNDPGAVRRVLVENVANYPKTSLEKRFFTAIFGAGLLGTDGELWRRHRRIMAPSFDPRSVAAYGPAVSAAAQAFVERWKALPPAAAVDMTEEMTDLTLRIISLTMFSTDDQPALDAINRSLRGGADAIGDVNLLDLLPVTGPARMRRRERDVVRLFAPLDELVGRLMAERQAAGGAAPPDLLTRLMAAADDQTGAKMTAREVRDEVVTIFMAGHETTAMTMDWIWYLLSQHPGDSARLHEELDRVLAGRPAGQDDLPSLPLARRTVEEAMRLYPAAPALSSRIALEADTLCGRPIAKGTNVAILPWVLHRHRALWDDPERFDPDRFLPARSVGRQRFAFLPFGAGPRVCIGQVLAMNEAVLILATLAQHFSPALAPDTRVALRANITLRPKHPLKMLLERRQSVPRHDEAPAAAISEHMPAG